MGYHFPPRLTATLNLCLIYFKITLALDILSEHMHKKFEINQTKNKGGCQSGRKVVAHNSNSDLPLITCCFCKSAKSMTVSTILCESLLLSNHFRYWNITGITMSQVVRIVFLAHHFSQKVAKICQNPEFNFQVHKPLLTCIGSDNSGTVSLAIGLAGWIKIHIGKTV